MASAKASFSSNRVRSALRWLPAERLCVSRSKPNTRATRKSSASSSVGILAKRTKQTNSKSTSSKLVQVSEAPCEIPRIRRRQLAILDHRGQEATGSYCQVHERSLAHALG